MLWPRFYKATISQIATESGVADGTIYLGGIDGAGGLSPLHSVRRIEKLDVMPVLGSGKIDYRTLGELLG